MNETSLVIECPWIMGLVFARESESVPVGGLRVAYAMSDGSISRQWWLWPVEHYDGAEQRPDIGDKINPRTIQLGKDTSPADLSQIRPITKHPIRLCSRWAEYRDAHPRVIHYQSPWQRLRRFFS